MKTCTKCGHSKKLDQFSKDASKKDKLCSHCKQCDAARVRKYQEDNREFVNKKYREYYAKNKEAKKERQRKYRLRMKHKHAAHKAVEAALKTGELKRKSCQHEGCKIKKTEAHHDDYSKPLEVIWLCKKHHGLRHRTV